MIGTVELVLFAIQSAIRLGEAGRRAFVDSTRGRALTLPLPNFSGLLDAQSAALFYLGDGSAFNALGSRVRGLTDRVSAGAALTEIEQSQYVSFYLEDRALLIIREGRTTVLEAGLGGVGADDWEHLLEIRQWRKGDDPNPSPLQRIAGTLVEIGVDYFQKDPSLIRSDRPTGKALATFLKAIDEVPFATAKPPQLVASLFSALAETIQTNPELFGDDEAARRLVENVTKALATDAQKRIEEAGDIATEESIQGWARFVFRSVLRSAGDTVLAAPELYLGVHGDKATLVQNVGLAMLDAMVTEKDVDLRALFTQDGMDGVMKAALRAVAASPNLLGISHDGLSSFVRSVAGEIAASSRLVGPDLLPETIRIVLDKTAEHVDVLLPKLGSPAQPLLAVASRTLLEGLAAPDPSGKWRPRFDKQTVVTTLEAVLDEVVENPAWVTAAAGGGSSPLGAVVEASLAALAGMPEPRLRPESALLVVQAAVAAGGRRLALLDPAGAAGDPLMKHALDVVFATLRGGDPSARWVLGRDEVVVLVATAALDHLADEGVSVARVDAIRATLEAERAQLAAGGALDLEQIAERLGAAIAKA